MASTISSAGGVKKWSLRSHSVSLASNFAASARCISAGTNESRRPITQSTPPRAVGFYLFVVERVRSEVPARTLVLVAQIVVVPRHEHDTS